METNKSHPKFTAQDVQGDVKSWFWFMKFPPRAEVPLFYPPPVGSAGHYSQNEGFPPESGAHSTPVPHSLLISMHSNAK